MIVEKQGHSRSTRRGGLASAVRLLDRDLNEAVRREASDLHIELERDGLRVRARVDGMLCDLARAARGTDRRMPAGKPR